MKYTNKKVLKFHRLNPQKKDKTLRLYRHLPMALNSEFGAVFTLWACFLVVCHHDKTHLSEAETNTESVFTCWPGCRRQDVILRLYYRTN